jgi:molybdopterin converting factor small subunit
MKQVQLEIMPWLSRYFDAAQGGRTRLKREVRDGATVRDLLVEIASQDRELQAVLFDAQTGRLTPHISVVLNGRFLELAGGLDTELHTGDNLRLMLAMSGG